MEEKALSSYGFSLLQCMSVNQCIATENPLFYSLRHLRLVLKLSVFRINSSSNPFLNGGGIYTPALGTSQVAKSVTLYLLCSHRNFCLTLWEGRQCLDLFCGEACEYKDRTEIIWLNYGLKVRWCDSAVGVSSSSLGVLEFHRYLQSPGLEPFVKCLFWWCDSSEDLIWHMPCGHLFISC